MKSENTSYVLAYKLLDSSGEFITNSVFTQKDYPSLLNVFIRNKIPGISITHKIFPHAILNSRFFNKFYKKEQNLYKETYSYFAEVLNTFNKNKIELLLLKSTGFFPYKTENLDILVRPEKIPEAKNLLTDIGYLELGNYKTLYKYLFRRFKDAKEAGTVHLHEKIIWGEVDILDEEILWQNKVISTEGFPIPSPTDSLLIILGHILFEEDKITISDLANFFSLVRKGNIDWEYLHYITSKKGWRTGFYQMANIFDFLYSKLLREDSPLPNLLKKRISHDHKPSIQCYFLRNILGKKLEFPFDLPKCFTKYHFYSKILTEQEKTISTKLKNVFSATHRNLSILIKYKYQEPYLITFTGLDGSGKTTQARLLNEVLRKCEIKTKYIWGRAGYSHFLETIKTIPRKIWRVKEQKNSIVPHSTVKSTLFKSPPIKFLWSTIITMDMLVRYYFPVRLALLNKRIVICDRYFWDSLVDLAIRFNDSDFQIRPVSKFLRRALPTPNLSFFLDISAENVLPRSDEPFLSNLKIREQFYSNAAQGAALIKLDATEGTEDLSDKVTYKVLTHYFTLFSA
ncbi:MAG: nucleotidyltransferase family protein [Candidatus Hodarchaeota archaeon]